MLLEVAMREELSSRVAVGLEDVRVGCVVALLDHLLVFALLLLQEKALSLRVDIQILLLVNFLQVQIRARITSSY